MKTGKTNIFRTGILLLLMWQFQVVVGNDTDSESNWDSAKLNTAASAGYLSSLEKEIVWEINRLRSNPAQYAEDFLVPLQNLYKRNYFYYPGDLPLQTNEGVSALNECIKVLKKQSQLPLIYPNNGLTKAARDHVRDQSKTGRTGHTGGDRSRMKDRIERYGDWRIRISENIAYGGKTARQIVIYLLIDDGVRDRGHRKNLLHSDFKKVGVATGSHPYYLKMCVMDFAGEFQNF